MRRIKIFDTTLRDGEQSPGIALQPHEKAEIARSLESDPHVDVVVVPYRLRRAHERSVVAPLPHPDRTEEFATAASPER